MSHDRPVLSLKRKPVTPETGNHSPTIDVCPPCSDTGGIGQPDLSAEAGGPGSAGPEAAGCRAGGECAPGSRSHAIQPRTPTRKTSPADAG